MASSAASSSGPATTTTTDSKIAFLTGASRGIGRSIAVALVQHGYSVMCVARSLANLKQTRAACEKAAPGCKVEVFAADVCDNGAMREALEATAAAFGGITALVHNVGLNQRQGVMNDTPSTYKALDRVIDVSLRSVMHLTVAAMPYLLKHAYSDHATASPLQRNRPTSHIVFVSSLMAKQFTMTPGHSAYVTAKHGMEGFAESLWSEVRQNGVRVSTIYPGLVNTDMGAGFEKEFGKMVDRHVPASAYLQPSDIADAVTAVLNAPPSATICEIHVQPQADLFRYKLFTDPARMKKLALAPGAVPFRDRQVALVTGAGRGIGRELALDLATFGFDCIAIIARTRDQLEAVAAQCRARNASVEVLVYALDVTDAAALEEAVNDVVAKCGTLSFVISNAGVNRRSNVALSKLAVWEQVTKINLLSAMHLTTLSLPHLIRHARQSARPERTAIAFNNTLGALEKQQLLPGTAIYSTTKAGLAAFARVTLADVRSYGVKVCTIFPGLVNTALGTRAGPLQKKHKSKTSAPETLIQSSDIAYAVRYLLSSSRTACPDVIRVHCVEHMMPLVREQAHAYVAANAPPWVAARCKL